MTMKRTYQTRDPRSGKQIRVTVPPRAGDWVVYNRGTRRYVSIHGSQKEARQEAARLNSTDADYYTAEVW